MRGGGKGMVLEWRGLECFVCFGQGPSVLQGQGLPSHGSAQLPPSLHGDWENRAPAMGGSALSPLGRLQEGALGALGLWMSFWRFWMSWGIFPCIWGWSRCWCAGARVAPCPVGVVPSPLDGEPAGDGGQGVGMPSTWGCGSCSPWLRVHPSRGCVLGAKGPGWCWSTRLYSVLPGSPTLVAAHAATVHESPQS